MADSKASGLTPVTTWADTDIVYAINAAGSADKVMAASDVRRNMLRKLATNAETASFTFADGDDGLVNTISNAGATTATVPPNATVAFDVGTVLILCQIGAGACTWTAGAGVTLNFDTDAYASLVTNGQYSYSFARKTATNTWEVWGGLVPLNPIESWSFALSDETTALTASDTVAKLTWYSPPYAITLTAAEGMVVTAPTDATLIMDVHAGGTTIMTTDKIEIETTEFHSKDATTPPALTTTAIAANTKMEFFVDQIGSTIAGAGAKVMLTGRKT